ncbi:MAG: hypothetical protein N3A38_09470 [Planctomycetota bacterium]|nr:hypothetical protein [Planctomycetota bacterium]
MKNKKTPAGSGKRAWLIGLGLDNDDGHVRVTRGENFGLFGGSKETHERMQEKAIKFNEELKARGKRLEEIGREEFCEIADKVKLGVPVVPPPGKAERGGRP